MDDENRSDIIMLAALKGAIISLPEEKPEEINKKLEAIKLFERVEENSKLIIRLRDENSTLCDKLCAIIEDAFHIGEHFTEVKA